MGLYDEPKSVFVAGFIGSPKMNFFNAHAEGGQLVVAGKSAQIAPHISGDVIVGIRPEHMEECDEASALISARLELVEKLGEYALVHMVSTDGTQIIAKFEKPPVQSSGDIIHFRAANNTLHLFDKTTEERL